MGLLRKSGLWLHRCFSFNPTLAKAYLSSWAWLLALLPDGSWVKRHIGNNLRSAQWPAVKLKPRRIELATGISALLVPTPGSLGFRAIYENRIGHEPGVPEFLASFMSRYDAVLEIGANVGVYTLLFSHCLPCDGRKRVFAYEPGLKAFACLEAHVALNHATNVATFNCAVAAAAGPIQFYENNQDFMKGSISPTVAALFPGASAQATTVPAVSEAQIAPLLQPFDRLLLKIDVMGSEPEVLAGLAGLVLDKKPDIVLGVWSENIEKLNQLRWLLDLYRLCRIGKGELTSRSEFTDDDYCNYFLQPTGSAHDTGRTASRI